jgi:hypothetical protein
LLYFFIFYIFSQTQRLKNKKKLEFLIKIKILKTKGNVKERKGKQIEQKLFFHMNWKLAIPFSSIFLV